MTFAAGEVTVTAAGAAARPVNVSDALKAGDVVATGKRSMATIQVNGVGVVRVLEESRVEMKRILSAEGTVLHLKTGSVFSKLMKKPGTNYRVETPTMLAAVRGTEFLTIASENRGEVLVREGTVTVSTKALPDGTPVTGKKVADVDQAGRISLTDQSRVQELTLDKYALHPYLKDVGIMNREGISGAFSGVEAEEKRIDEEIEKAREGEDLSRLSPLDRLRKLGKPLTKLYLKDKSQLIGSVEKSTDSSVSLNTGESVIEIPKGDIARRVPAK